MNDQPNGHIENLDAHLQGLEKRFDDVKWYFGGATTLFALAMSIFTLVSSWNFSNERNNLLQFENNLRADLGKEDVPPELEALVLGGNPLDGNETTATIEKTKDGQKQLRIVYAMRNIGGSRSGPISISGYSNEPIKFDNLSVDEPRFKYESHISEKNFDPGDIPVGYASQYWTSFNISREIPSGRYPFLMKIFYGRNKMVRVQFNILIKD